MKTQIFGLCLAFSLLTFVSCGEKKNDEKKVENTKEAKEEGQKEETQKEVKEQEPKQNDNQDIAKKIIGKWKLVKIIQPKMDGTEGLETKKGQGFISFEETSFEEDYANKNVPNRKGKWKFVKLPKEMIEAEKVLVGIDLGTNPDMGDYVIKSINEKEMILIPQGGEASIMTYYYEKVK